VDRRHRRAVSAYHKSETERWKCCLYAYRVVGKRDGRTAAFAAEIRRSSSMVENYAHAAEMMIALRAFGVSYKLRKRLTISHYYTMWDMMRKHDISLSDVYEELMTAAHEGVDARQMRKAVDEANGGGVSLEKRLKRMYNDALYLVTDGSIPDKLFDIMMGFLNWYKESHDRS
jgi:hypothetical protein